MLVRTLTGALFIIVLVSAILISPYTALALFLIFVILGLQEFYKISNKNKISTQKTLGTVLGMAVFLVSSGVIMGKTPISSLLILVPMTFLVFIAELFRKKKNPFTNIAFTLLAVVYISLPFSLLFGLGFFNQYTFSTNYQPNLLIGILVLMWSNDTGAYLVGKSFGKNKLFERISPRKTWEGSIGGAILTLIVAYIVNHYWLHIDVPDWFFVALFIIFFGSIGDLIESMFKRSAHVKDSSDLLPGHGGVLDRFDSLLLATPFVYSYLQLICKI